MSSFTTDLFDSVWVPASRMVPRSQQKVLVVLHGAGDSLKAFRNIKQELRLPGLNYLLLNAPRRYEDGFSWCALNPQKGSASVKKIRQKLFGLVEQLKDAGWRSRDLLWMGHSQGCLVAGDLVLNYPERFGAVIGVSGYLWFNKGWKQKAARGGALRTPWLITHGTRDRVIRPSEIRADIKELSSADVPLVYREFSKGHDFDYRREVPFIRRWLSVHS